MDNMDMIHFIFITWTLFMYNLSFTSSGTANLAKDAIETNFTMEVIKHGIIARLDRIRIVNNFKTDSLQRQRFTINSLISFTKSLYTVVEVNNFLNLDFDNKSELVWFPNGITDPQLQSLVNSSSHFSLKIKYFLLSLSEPERDTVIYNLVKRFDSQFFYYNTVERWDPNSSTLILKEVYRMREGPDGLKTNDLASFSSIHGFRLVDTRKSIWSRRNTLNGTIFEAVFDKQKVGVVKVSNRTYKNKIIYHPHGMIYDIMKILAKRLNFTVNYIPAKENSSWSDIVRLVGNGEYVFTNNIITLNLHRSNIVDLSIQLIESSLRLFYPRSVSEIKWTAYFKSFQFDAWVFLGFHFLGTGVAMYVITRIYTLATKRSIKTKRLSNKYVKQTKSYLPTMSWVKLLKKSINFSCRSIIGKRHREEPEKFPIRIIFLSATFAGFVIITAYRSMLAASIAIEIDHPPVHSLEDVYRLSKKLIVWKGTEIERSFTQAKPGTIENKINKAGLLVPIELNDVTFLKDFILGYFPNTILLTYKKLAMKMNPNNDREKPYPCKFRDAGEDYGKVRAGTVFPKDWQYTKLFNYNFLRLQEEGILEIIRNKYVPTKVKKCGNHGRNMSQSNLFETLSAFVFLAMAQGLAFFVFIVEWLSRRDC